MRNKEFFVISGIHRSGTTFLAKLLNSNNLFSSIHEPLNFDVGIKKNKFWYPYHSLLNENFKESAALENVSKIDLDFKSPKKTLNPLRAIFKSRGNIDFLMHKYFFSNKKVLYKDPFMSMCGNYFLQKNKKTKIVYLIRHPKSFYKSNLKMGWDFDFRLFPLKGVLSDFPELKSNIFLESHEERLYSLYNIIYFVIFLTIKNFPNQTYLLRHEDFCINPVEETKRLCRFLHINFSSKHEKFIKKHMLNEEDFIKKGKQFNFKRNSKKIAIETLGKKIIELEKYKHIFKSEILNFYE